MHGRRWFFRPVGLDGDAGGNESERGNTDQETSTKNSTRPQEETNWRKLIWEDFLPNALTIGVPYEVFWHLNPTKLKPFQTAFENKRKLRDEENWLIWGTYGMSALSVVLASAFSKNSQAKYVEKPMYQQVRENTGELTEEEKKRQTEQIFAQLQIMATNYNLNHKGDNK